MSPPTPTADTSPEPATDLRARLMAALAAVQDPEIGESIVDLGLVHALSVDGEQVLATLIPTSATCPMVDVLVDDAEAALRAACPTHWTVVVDVDWDTPWSPEGLSPELKARFGW